MSKKITRKPAPWNTAFQHSTQPPKRQNRKTHRDRRAWWEFWKTGQEQSEPMKH